ncbi:lipocalin-like domain-containing protein [Pseudohongiella sp. SYSU M77423]|uniref:lipocalin-like domain-containing protein n=1 Tax=Pseudohongiella sp. SYSU M77423 TaxID=3042312 RepID=UPI002480B495|nr:lipocalin-like domain-containing protein [Pseudohongiella sp. SYSU M77423]MDH7942828.1 lipocalin-like domain-containing protein [Pseudohongiella sp. SYSU M77423]
MRRTLMGAALVSAAVLLAAVWSNESADAAQDDALMAVKQQFVGHYELVSFVSFPATGGEVDNNYVGRIMYDENDQMSAQGMPKDLPERAAQTTELVRGGFAYWGPVTWDISQNKVTHHVEGSPTRGSWVGEDNVRYYEFTPEGLLKLSIRDENGRTTGTLTWRRIED